MPHSVIKRAAALFLASFGIISAVIGALIWYHLRIANPCPPDGMLNGQPVACYYRLQTFELDDWPWVLAALILGLGICILAAWLSLKFRRPTKSGEA